MIVRKVVAGSAAAFALVALSVPAVNAQSGESGVSSEGSGILDAGSLKGGSLEDGSLEDGSLSGGGAGGGSGEDGSTGSGSLDAGSAQDSSVGALVLEPEGVCELPDLGGSVAKFYPLFGISGIPSSVIDLVTSALGSFPNLLDVVAGEDGGAALVGGTGSLADPLCTSIFGGEMVMPPVTVIVDESGAPYTTVTGTVVRSTTRAVTSTSTGSPAAESSAPGAESTSSSGSAGEGARTGTVALPTSVPVPAN